MLSSWKKYHPGALSDISPAFLSQLVDCSWQHEPQPIFMYELSEQECLVFLMDYLDPTERALNTQKHRFEVIKGVNVDGASFVFKEGSLPVYRGNSFTEMAKIVQPFLAA